MKKDVSIKIDEIDENTFNIQIGPNGYTVMKSRLKELMDFDGDSETLIRNIAIRLSLGGINIDDIGAVKNDLEKITFKF